MQVCRHLMGHFCDLHHISHSLSAWYYWQTSRCSSSSMMMSSKNSQTGITATVYICDLSSCCCYDKYHTARAVLAKPLQFFVSGNISTSWWRCCNWHFWLSFPSISTIMRGQTHMYTYAFSNHVWSKFDNSAIYWSVCADGKNLSDLHPTKLPLLWLSVRHFAIIHFRSELPHTISGVIM